MRNALEWAAVLILGLAMSYCALLERDTRQAQTRAAELEEKCICPG